MRFTVVVAVLVSLSTVNAYGTRGAAERYSQFINDLSFMLIQLTMFR